MPLSPSAPHADNHANIPPLCFLHPISSKLFVWIKVLRPTQHKVGQSDTFPHLGTTANQVAMVWEYAEKEDNDWVKKCVEHEVEGARPRGRPKKTWTEIVQKESGT